MPQDDARIHRARKLRIAAFVALALGVIGMGIVCWAAVTAGKSDANLPPASYFKKTEMQDENLYGKSAVVMERIKQALKQPGAQVIIILISSVAVAGGCWRLAQRMED